MLGKLSSEIARPLEPTEEELNPAPKEYRFHLGDTVYLGVQEYEIPPFDLPHVLHYDVKS
jgi:hypothetical protein